MEKIIKRTISLTAKKRDSRNKLFEEFYSHDKNNAVFEFTVEDGIPTEEIVVLFHFKRTNRHLEVRGRVDNDKIIVNFDTSLIIKDEQVAGYIYYENGEKSNDVYRFMFDVHVSEIDKEHDLPVMEQESKRIVPLTDIVTKSEITELLKKIVANEKLYDDTEIKQQIELKADKEAVQAISSKVEALEAKADNDTVYNDSELRGQIATKADNQSVEAIAKRVETLENKPDNDTELRQAVEKKADKEALLQYLPKSELTPINEKVQSLETNIGRMATQQQLESYVSKNELENKGYLTSADTHDFALKSEIPVATNLDNINDKIRALEEKPPVDLSNLATKEELEAVRNNQPKIDTSDLVTKQELEDKHYLTTHQDISNLVTKQELHEATEIDYSNIVTNDELESKHYLTEHQSLDGLVTKSELEQKGYLTAHQSLEDYSKKTELAQITERVQHLEERPQVDTSKLVSKEELEQKNYLTAHQSLENVVTKEELEAKGYLTNHQDLSEYAKKTEIPPQFDSKPLVDRIDLLESKAIANGAYNDKPLLDKIHEVQESLKGFITQSSRYLTEHQSLSHLVTKDELASKGYITNHQSLEHLVTKEELEQKGYLTAHQSLENLVTKDELANKGYLTTHQDISGLVTKQELEDKHYLTAHQDISNLATNAKVEEVETRVQTLENKPPVDLSHLATKEELEVVRGSQLTVDNPHFATKEELEAVRNSQQKVDTSLLVTKQELEEKNYLTEHQSLANLVTKDELEAKGYLNAHQSLEEYAKKSEIPHVDTSGLATKEELSVVKQKQDTIKPETYVTKDELAQKGYLTAHQSLENVVTKQELEAKGYLTNHQDISNLATNSKVSEVENRVNTLENAGFLTAHQDLSSYATKEEVAKKVDKETFDTLKQDVVTHNELANRNYLTEHQSLEGLVTKSELEQKGYLTAHQSLTEYAKKSELPPQYNDSELRGKISNLETNSVTKTELAQKGYLTAHQSLANLVTKQDLESKQYLTAHQSLSEYARKSELPQPYNDTELRGQIASKASNQTVDSLTNRVRALEIKPDNDTVYNDTEVKRDIDVLKRTTVSKQELESKRYLTAHQSLDNYALKSELNAVSVYRIAKGDISGGGVGASATITKNDLMNADDVKVGDIVQDFWVNNSEEGFWKVTAVNGNNITLIGIGSRRVYIDDEIKRRISSLESRPTFDTLTPSQRNSLKGENGHSLNVNVRIEGNYRNGATSQLNLFADVYYDGERVTSGYTLDYYYRGFGNNNWGVLRNQTPDSTGKFGTWGASQRSGGWFEVRIEVSYRGLKDASFTRLDNVNDGSRGDQGVAGENIINQQNRQALKYWYGSKAQYNAIRYKDASTIYDVYE